MHQIGEDDDHSVISALNDRAREILDQGVTEAALARILNDEAPEQLGGKGDRVSPFLQLIQRPGTQPIREGIYD